MKLVQLAKSRQHRHQIEKELAALGLEQGD